MSNIYIIGIAGGTSSGKTTVANAIIESIGQDNICYLCHDYYYKDLSNLSKEEIEKVNFDHPNSLDTQLLIRDLEELIKVIQLKHQFIILKNHTRLKETFKIINPKKLY